MLLVSPPRASHFSQSSGCRTTQKKPKELAPSSGPTASGALTPLSLWGPARWAIHGLARLSRHPCRSSPGATTAFGLLEGRFRCSNVFASILIGVRITFGARWLP
ncbi:hypothetical protein TUM20286_36650 [Pseudomonas tohonis]|uniref:Uncharacterized protein n=1 Tax=Pseudomonas tohonis TaxID=2725477 RepID=A0ABQ4W382_9PSED|nr:hypothetical protein TUM20286_36650 [Pseudomonas tohonis]